MPKEIIQKIIREQIEPNMNPPAEEWSTDHLPGLMESVDGFTPKFGLSLFTAATQYLCTVMQHEEKLKKMKFSPLSMAKLDENNKAKLSVHDHRPLELHLTVYKNEAEAKHIIAELEKEGEEVDMSKKSLQNCVFLGEGDAPFEDIDAKEKYDWPCAASAGEDPSTAREGVDLRDLYPIFAKMDFGEDGVLTIRRPQLIELQMFEVALSAISAFIMNNSQGQDRIGIQMTSYAMKGEPTEIKAVIEAKDSLDGSSGVMQRIKLARKLANSYSVKCISTCMSILCRLVSIPINFAIFFFFVFVCIKVHIPNRCCFFPSLRWHSGTFSHLLNFSKFILISNASKIISLFLLILQNHVKFLSSSFFGFQSFEHKTTPQVSIQMPIGFLANLALSSCVKSLLMLNVLRISAGVFPLIIFATVWQHKSSNSLISM